MTPTSLRDARDVRSPGALPPRRAARFGPRVKILDQIGELGAPIFDGLAIRGLLVGRGALPGL